MNTKNLTEIAAYEVSKNGRKTKKSLIIIIKANLTLINISNYHL